LILLLTRQIKIRAQEASQLAGIKRAVKKIPKVPKTIPATRALDVNIELRKRQLCEKRAATKTTFKIF